MARSNLELQIARSPVLRYGLAVASFVIALGLALLAQHYGFRLVTAPPGNNTCNDVGRRRTEPAP